jgi:hypothetical protein
MVRADSMHAQFDGSEVSVPVIEIVERTFTLFESESSRLMATTSHFSGVTNLVRSALGSLLQLIACCVYREVGCTSPLDRIVQQLPFQLSDGDGSGALMRFLFESPEEQVRRFIGTVTDLRQLRGDLDAALAWWDNMRRATEELRQRSLKPNSRVSSLRNFLVLFECADEFVRSRGMLLRQWMCA